MKEIKEELESLPLLRPAKELKAGDRAAVVCRERHLDMALDFYGRRLRILPLFYVYPEQEDACPKKRDGVPLKAFAELSADVPCHLFTPPAPRPGVSGFNFLSRQIAGLGIADFSVESISVSQFWGREKIRYSEEQWETIAHIAGSLADKTSRGTWLACCRARQTAMPGYIPLALYPQYRHPSVPVAAGDAVCEGGVDTGGSTLQLAERVGAAGMVHAFEPVEESFAACRSEFTGKTNISLHNQALWSFSGTLSLVGATHKGNTRTVDAAMEDGGSVVASVSVDAFFQDARLDFLKLDVEGAEKEVLLGAKKTLARCRPGLAICIYHNGGADLLSIPQHILETGIPYRLYVGHHTGWFGETVLYAVCRASRIES